MLALAGGCDRCKKKETEAEVVEPPPPGGASQELVSTSIGNGIGLPANLAPTSAEWDHVVVVDGNTAVVHGHMQDEAIAIRTTDRGRTWRALRASPGAYQSWGTGRDGASVLAGGERKKMKAAPGKKPAVIEAKLWFAPDELELSEPAPLFPDEKDRKGIGIDDGIARPAVLGAELASLIVDRQRQPIVLYGAPVGNEQPAAIDLPRGRWIRAPYGRPPMLLSVVGTSLEVRPWPTPGGGVDLGSKVPSLTLIGSMADQLDAGPHCDAGAFSFARVATTPQNAQLIGISDTRAFAFPLPGGDETRLGCTTEAVVVEIVSKRGDAGPGEPQLIRCTLDGKCAQPKSYPFNIWPEEHKRKILAVPTPQGVVATMTAQTGNRFGTYLATSMDKGATFELPRVIGEGQTGRGFFDVGALVAFDDRVVMLLTADVTGTRGRRWYAMASDDGGENWGPP